MLTNLKALWHTEPTRVITLLTALVVFAAAKFGVLVDDHDVATALALVVPVVLGGETIRSQVSPAQPATEASDDLLPDGVIE